ncbi:hypothetical protein LG634_15475 [Streptomyces bambusae]|uniref:hypothetical protein n=1 Tax=Streptomyces bambusae TaxID=1550616 RepID=UPI001CFEA9C1|nr:hypothetical protein [Streptomyces bambusae]MCB5166229.1 hypothetical protein [Streptomyces bambusae]
MPLRRLTVLAAATAYALAPHTAAAHQQNPPPTQHPRHPTATADGPADVALAIGTTTAAATATALWLRSRHRRDARQSDGET